MKVRAAFRSSTWLLLVALTLGLVATIAAAQTWNFLDATSVSRNGTFVSGRINAAVQDPKNPNVVYVATDGARPTGSLGSPDGDPVVGLPDTGGAGVWKTTDWLDTNPTWTSLTDSMPSPSVGIHGLVMVPNDSSTLYAAADGPSGCILKTTDGGATWTALATTQFASVKFGGIAISPADPQTLYAAVFRGSVSTPGGVYKSTDSGVSWSLAGGMAGDVSHVALNPANSNFIYAGFVDPGNPSQQGVWLSTDGGASWQQQNNNFPPHTFSSALYIEFAFAPSNPEVTYAVIMQPQNKPLPSFYRTVNGGAKWKEICVTSSDPDNRYWHQPLTVNPLNPDIVYAEGLNHFGVFTTNGGQPHAARGDRCTGVWTTFWTGDDPAGVEFFNGPGAGPASKVIAAFGDRGIYQVIHPSNPDERTDFSNKQGNLANPLLVSIAVNPSDASSVFAVAVDQGATMTTSSSVAPYWKYTATGAEFGKTLISPTQPSLVYNLCTIGECIVSQVVERSTDGGMTWSPISQNLTNGTFPYTRSVQLDAAAWKAFELDPAVSDGLLMGATAVYSWTHNSPWTRISPFLANISSFMTRSFISALGVTPAAPQQILAATSDGALYLTSNRSSWSQITSLSLPLASFISRIEMNPADASSIVIAVQGTTAQGRVWLSGNRGSSWTDLTGNLPLGLQVYTVAVDWGVDNPPIFLGTDRGVYECTASCNGTWQAYGTGLPNTLIDDLRIAPPGTMSAAAYGRGIYQVSVPAPTPEHSARLR